MSSVIRIGTRGSRLAMWQTDHVNHLLRDNGLSTEVTVFQTKGDKILDKPIPEIGSKGVFTEELEIALRNGEIDIAIHSAKDLQSQLAPDLDIIAFTRREQPNDVIVSLNEQVDLENDVIRIGTSSTRRRALFQHFYPQLEIVEMRGNLQTRMGKMEAGDCDALALAYAGVHRMGYDDKIKLKLDLNQFTPAVGQGSIALESSSMLSHEKKEAIRHAVNDLHTEQCLIAERAFLGRLEGGCSIPVFGLAQKKGDTIELAVGIISLDGQELIRLTQSGSADSPETIGNEAANDLLARGGDRILAEIRKQS